MRLWHEIVGDGDQTVLTMHGGLGFDHRYMKASFARLAGPDRRVVFYDHRGNGRSVPFDRASITIEQLADDAAALLDQIGAAQAVVLGHSYGGFVAQEFALRHPDRLAGLVLIDTTPGQLGARESTDTDEQGPPLPPELVEVMSQLPQSDEEFVANKPRMLPFYLHDRDRVAALEAITEGTIFRADPLIRGFEILAGWSSVDRLATITAPTLVLVGRHDLHTSWPQSRRIASRIPGAELVILEESAHFPWVEEPDAFWATLEGWLDR